MSRWTSIVLAAGKGTRMNSDRAKVLHELDGESLLGRVLATARRLSIERHIVVIGHQADAVREAHGAPDVDFVLQEPQLGTGHAVLVARDLLERREGSLLVLYGDVPLLRSSTLQSLLERHEREENGATVLTACLEDPTGYGRIVRDGVGRFERIVEDRDLEPGQERIDEINSGIYTFRIPDLRDALERLDSDNAQGEYYLTDTLSFIRGAGAPVGILRISDSREISGINTVEQLREAEEILARRRSLR